MSEDEEVVFEGHELHHYLCQQGFTDFEVVRCSNLLQDSQTKKSEIQKPQLWNAAKEALQHLIPKWWMPNNKKLAPLQLEVEVILKSGLLLEDDSHFLESLALPIDFINEKPLWTGITLLHGILLCGTMFIWKKEVIHGLFPFIHSLLAAEHFFSKWHFSAQRNRMSGAVNKLLSCCKDLYLLQKKSLHFVQENELLLRGFTLVKTSSSASNPESPVVSCLAKRWYVMSGLRVSIAQSALEAINVLQIATQTLVTSCPLSGQLDKRNHYSAFLSAEDLGIAGIDTAEGAELPLVLLKKLHQVYILLQSEFLRRLALCFVVKLWKDVGQNILSIFILVDNVSTKYFEYLSNLNQDYKFFSCYGLNSVDHTNFKTPRRNSRRYFGAHVGIHSARLHLQGMLHRTKEVEELLETQSDETEVAHNETLSQNLTNVLMDIVTEMHSCRSCLDVAISQLAVPKEPYIPHSDAKSCESLTKNTNEQVQKPIVVGFTDLDPQVEDEVFEAIISHDNLNTGSEDDADGNFVSLDAADQFKRKMEKECSDRLLSELKTVLVHKAYEWEEREAKALKNKALRNAGRADVEREATVKPSGSVLCLDCDCGQGNDGEASGRAGGFVSLGERSSKGKNITSTPETVEGGSNLVHADPFVSLVMKPEGNWPLPRLKTGKLFSASRSSSSTEPSHNVEVSSCFLDRAAQVKTLIVGASGIQPNYLGSDVSEETFSGSGENSSSSESENNEQ